MNEKSVFQEDIFAMILDNTNIDNNMAWLDSFWPKNSEY